MIDTEKLEELVAGDYLTESMKELMIQQRDEVKRLREAIADVANNMEAADPSLLRSFIKDLLEVIE